MTILSKIKHKNTINIKKQRNLSKSLLLRHQRKKNRKYFSLTKTINKTNPVKSILVICAHSDDEIFGPGATLAKFASKGINIFTVILSYGEKSNPLYRKKIIKNIRIKEAIEADKIIGGNGVSFIGLTEGNFIKEYEKHKHELINIILDKKPDVIFTHSLDDWHKDHRDTLTIVKDLLKTISENKDYNQKLDKKPQVFAFDIWTIFNIKKGKYPKMYVDVSDYFKIKLKALSVFKSQKMSLISLGWLVYLTAIINGFKTKKKYAEVFYKVI